MNVNNVFLDVVVGNKSQLPDFNKVEIAFAGKSNVGKSSLLNCLINRKALARTSGKPGKTQTLNFYNVEEKLYFVDLPGYGYAKVSKKDQERWGKLTEDYLMERQQLRMVVLLIDIRHEPGKNDKMMYDWIVDNGFYPLIVATKADKLKRSQVQQHVKMIKNGLKLNVNCQIIPFSAVTKQGKDEIWEVFEELLEEVEIEKQEDAQAQEEVELEE